MVCSDYTNISMQLYPVLFDKKLSCPNACLKTRKYYLTFFAVKSECQKLKIVQQCPCVLLYFCFYP